jgi:hypothetical protein
MPLLERLELAAQACRAAHLLSCEASVREAITALSEKPAHEEAEQARRFRLIQSAYANEYRLRDAVRAEMKEAGARGELMMNGQAKDWPAYVKAIERREQIVEEIVNADAR